MLGALRAEFDRTAAALARVCANGSALDAERLDERQLASYELALASADLLAAETSVGPIAEADASGARRRRRDPALDGFDARLALVYAADAVGAVIERLQAIGIELDLDLAPLDRLAADTEWRALRRAVSSGPALDRLGAEIAAGHVEVGHIAFDEPLALAQDAFRRFAAEVVAPQAEAIHRHDLTVPEALLQPLREMGVFGLSIPERYGGSRARRPRRHADDAGRHRGAVGGVAGGRRQPDHAARDPGARAARRRHRGAAGSTGCRASPRGDPLCAIAITEPDYGSDVAEPRAAGDARRRRLAARRRQDLVHLRRQGRPADGGRAHRPRSRGWAIAA